jgi:hypothetical protein
MHFVSGITNHEAQAISQCHLIGWIGWIQMLGLEIAIHDQ